MSPEAKAEMADTSYLIWLDLARNPHPGAINIIDEYLHKGLYNMLCMRNKHNWLWGYLAENPSAIKIIEANPYDIRWDKLSSNPNAIHLLEANPEKINWKNLSSNPNAIHLLEANPEKIDWAELSRNPSAIHLLEQNPEKIDWRILSSNPNAIHLLEANLEKIDWTELMQNPSAIRLLEQNIYSLSLNDKLRLTENPAVIDTSLMQLLDQRYPTWSYNPAAIHLLEANPKIIIWNSGWKSVWANPATTI